MNKTMLKAIVRVAVRDAGQRGINPDFLRDVVCEKYGYVPQEYFDSVVQSMTNIKMFDNKLYNTIYVCSCGCLKSPKSFFCYQCIAEKKENLIFYL